MPKLAGDSKQMPQRRFRAYPDHRDSGVGWLGDVPTHWKVRKLKHIASLRTSNVDKKSHEQEQPVRLCNYTDVYYNEQITADLAFMEATASLEEIEKFSLMKGDVLITKDSEDPNDIAVPACVVDDLEGVLCGYHLAQVRSNPSLAHGPYLARAFKASGIRDQFNSQATGITRHGLSKDTIGCSQFLVPPLDEQQAIAAFLDRETARIDELIAKKQRLIELLAEKRTALLTHIQQKWDGAKLTPTESPFFPGISTGWNLVRLKFLCRDVADGPHFSPQYVDDGILFLSARNVKVDKWSFGDAKFIDDEVYAQCCRRVKPTRGDVLYTKGGTTGIARAVDFDEPFNVWVHIIVLRLREVLVNPFFLAYALNSSGCYEQSQLYTRGATNNDLGLTRVINIHLPLPDLATQELVVDDLDSKCASLDRLIGKVGDAIGRIREYRSALISAAVTGKIDVRCEPGFNASVMGSR